MTEIEGYLDTIEPELRVLTGLFGFPESVWEAPGRFVPVACEQEGLFRIVFETEGYRAERAVAAPEGEEPLRTLHRRRAARRLCKQTLYDL